MSGQRILRTRRDFLEAKGALVVMREPPEALPQAPGQPPMIPPNPAEGVEILLAVWDDGKVTGLNGHVDLGTGIRTALAQIIAEELDVEPSQVEMVLGDTAMAPNQGPTIASASIQITAVPLRQAAAQARAFLLARAASALGVEPTGLVVSAGVVSHGEQRISYADLVRGEQFHLLLDPEVDVKPVQTYRVVGQSAPRVDIPAKVAGELVFVHDKRLPGMLHGRVVRPPYAGADHGDFIGNTLESVDESSIAHIPGVRAVVVIRDFVGVVAEREDQAEAAALALKVHWRAWPGLPSLDDPAQALRDNPAVARKVIDEGDVDSALTSAAQELQREYVWPYQMHASIGPSCGVAQWHGGDTHPAMTVWTGSQNPHVLRAELSKLMQLPDVDVEVVRMEASGCYGRNSADDVCADAALLSRAVRAPVRVQLSREQENLWEPKGAAQLMTVRGGLASDNSMAAYDFTTSYPSNAAPTLALLLTRTIEPVAQAFAMGDRTARPPYEVPNLRVTVNDMAPILRASWLRGVSALPNSFAHESYVDELATAAGADPVQFRLRHLTDERAIDVLRSTAERAGWVQHTVPQQKESSGNLLRGQGVAYARYMHSKWPGFGAAWTAWVADVEVNRSTGEVRVNRVVVGHDSGQVVNPAGVRHQVQGNVVQTTSRALKERVQVDPVTSVVVNREWGSYPILGFRDLPTIDVHIMPRQSEPPLGAGESSSVPGTAAIANAIFDATGVRFRHPPFTAEVVRAAINPLPAPAAAPLEPVAHPPPADAVWPRRRSWWAKGAALAVSAVGVAAALFGWRSVISPVARIDTSVYSADAIERGRQLAAAGNCATCHTAPGGEINAGGLAMPTPFGTVYATNLTPDVDTGIGAWSFSAFQRAMRDGVSRDGHHLYPAFPYTAFTKVTDDDLMALYAYLMVQPAVHSAVPETKLAFPFSVRPMLAFWNALFLNAGAQAQADPQRSPQWNRGAYLVNGLGHCGACHTDRNAFGAEREGKAFLGGAFVKGWEAPALTSATRAPVPWTENALFDYMRVGHSALHGVASGPMAPVVREFAALPDTDIRAMAHYLASFNPPVTDAQAASAASAAVASAQAGAAALAGPAQRMFETACGSCHHDGDGPRLLGVNVPLALNSNLHADLPDNLLRVILEGHLEPASIELGFMPAFGAAFDDRQLAELTDYMRRRFAPGKPPWTNLEAEVARVRSLPSNP